MSYLSQPTHLEALRLRIISQIAEILENQTHTQRYAIGLSELNHNMHQEIVSKLVAAMATMATDDSAAMIAMIPTISQVIDTCSRLDQSLDLLFRQRSQQWASSDQHIQNLMIEFNQTLLELSSVLIEKDLLERQSRVLERIILSHEHISQWKEFVQEILADFYAIFPFNFFLHRLCRSEWLIPLFVLPGPVLGRGTRTGARLTESTDASKYRLAR